LRNCTRTTHVIAYLIPHLISHRIEQSNSCAVECTCVAHLIAQKWRTLHIYSRTSLWMLGFIDFKKAGSAVSRIQVQSGRGCTGSAREAGGKCEMSWFQTMKRVSLLCAASPEGPGGSPKGPRRSPKGPRRSPGVPRRPGGFRRVPGNPGECRGSPDFLRGSTEGPRRIRGGSAEDARTFPGGPRRISVWRHFTL